MVSLLALVGLGSALRFFSTWSAARLNGEYVLSADADPFYHLRRLEYAARNHGAVLVDDPFASAPARFECDWPITLEPLTLALNRLVFGAQRDRASLLLSAGVLPVLIGMLAIVAAFLALLVQTPAGAAVAGAAVMTVAPAAISAGAFFAYDHHGLELVLYMLLPAAAVWAQDFRRPALPAALGALAFGLSMLATDMTHLLMITLGGAFVLRFLLGGRKPQSLESSRSLRAFAAGGLVGVMATSALELAMAWPRLFSHRGRIGIMVGVVGASLLTGGRRARVAAAGLLGLGLLLALPTLLAGASYLGAGDRISAQINETRPLWSRLDPPRLMVYLALYGLVMFQSLRQRLDVRGYPLLVAALVGGTLGLLQNKYAFLLAFASAWAVGHAMAMVSRRWVRVALGMAVVAAVVERAGFEVSIEPSDVSPADAAFAKMARLIAERTPPQSVYVPGERPGWTVLTEPSMGPRLLYLAERAVTSIPFWGTPALTRQFEHTAQALVGEDQAGVQRLLDEMDVRYVLVTDLAPVSTALAAIAGVSPTFDRALWARLYRDNGSARLGPSALAALGRFRLVAESGQPGSDSDFKLFERVRGARICGAAPRGAQVAALLHLHTPDGPDVPYLVAATGDDTGHFAITLPYSTEPSPRAAYAIEARLRCPGHDVPLQISESAVVSGAQTQIDCP